MISMPDTEVAHQARQQVEDLGLHHHVEGGGGLVGHDQLRRARKCHRDHHPLLLAAGELVRVGPPTRRGQPDLLQQATDASVDVGVGRPGLVHPDRLGDLFVDPLDRVERVQRALEHDGRAGPAQRAEVTPAHGQDILPVHRDAAADLGVLGLQAQDRSGHRALATAGLPRQSDDLPRADGQVDAADGGQRAIVRAVGDGEAFEAEQVGHRRAFSRGLKISSSA